MGKKLLSIHTSSSCPRFEQGAQKKFSTLLTKSIDEFEKFLFTYRWGLGLKRRDYAGLSLNLCLCGDSKIRALNKAYRGLAKVTDVLSFPVHDDIRKGDFFSSPMMELGDIYISLPVAKRQAKEFELPTEYEIMYLLIHGWLHLLGFDHELSTKEEELMESHEDKIFCKIRKLI